MIRYDAKYDVLYVIFSNTHNSYGDEDENGVVQLKNGQTDEVVGLIVYDFKERYINYDSEHDMLYVRFADEIK